MAWELRQGSSLDGPIDGGVFRCLTPGCPALPALVKRSSGMCVDCTLRIAMEQHQLQCGHLIDGKGAFLEATTERSFPPLRRGTPPRVSPPPVPLLTKAHPSRASFHWGAWSGGTGRADDDRWSEDSGSQKKRGHVGFAPEPEFSQAPATGSRWRMVRTAVEKGDLSRAATSETQRQLAPDHPLGTSSENAAFPSAAVRIMATQFEDRTSSAFHSKEAVAARAEAQRLEVLETLAAEDREMKELKSEMRRMRDDEKHQRRLERRRLRAERKEDKSRRRSDRHAMRRTAAGHLKESIAACTTSENEGSTNETDENEGEDEDGEGRETREKAKAAKDRWKMLATAEKGKFEGDVKIVCASGLPKVTKVCGA